MKEKSLLLQLTGEMPLFRIIDFFVENKGMDFTKNDVIKSANISRGALFNYWPELEKYGILKITRRFGKTKLYTLNVNNPLTQKILDLELELIKEAMNKSAEKQKLKIAA